MFKHNLFELFKTFSAEDLNSYELFLKSPYFNGSKKMLNLYKEIIKHYPDFNNGMLNKKQLSLSTSVSGRYNESTLRDALSELLKLTLKYLTITNFEKNSFDMENYLLEELLHRKLNRVFEKKVKNKFYLNKLIDPKYLYNKYWYDTMVFNYDITNKKVLHKKDAIDRVTDLRTISLGLNKFYISEIVSLKLNSKILANKYNIDYSGNPINILVDSLSLDKLIKIYDSEDSIIINIYKHLLESFENFENEQCYYKYKSLVENNKHLLSVDEIAFHYSWLINYCIVKKKSPSKQSDFDEELFALYNIFIINKYYKDRNNRYLPVDMYRGIMIHGFHLKQYRWVRDFIKKFSSEVDPNEKENIINYSYTYYYCNTGDYIKALEYYNKIIMNNFILKYDIKNLVLKMYYELGYFEEALCEIKSFKEFLRNNSLVTEARKTRLGKYLKYFEKLILHQMGNNKIDIGFLKRKLKEEKNITYKDWLYNKLSVL